MTIFRSSKLWIFAVTGVPGEVSGPAPLSETIISTLPSSPFADETLKANLDAATINPPVYSVWYDCNNFVLDHILDGINIPQSIMKSLRAELPTQDAPDSSLDASTYAGSDFQDGILNGLNV
jgi:hypothetical protein